MINGKGGEFNRVGRVQVPSTQEGVSSRSKLRDSEEFKAIFEKLNGSVTKSALNQPASNSHGLKFSNHAIERMLTRGLILGPEQLSKLQEAVARAEAKGSKDALVLLDGLAAIVSVKNKTVVTLMDQAQLKKSVFTNIDTTVFA